MISQLQPERLASMQADAEHKEALGNRKLATPSLEASKVKQLWRQARKSHTLGRIKRLNAG
jgi:hypothetical protein